MQSITVVTSWHANSNKCCLIIVMSELLEHGGNWRITMNVTEIERSEFPPVILSTQVHVAHHYGDFRARDQQNDENQREEAKHVVEPMQPDRREDKKHLHENGAERQKPARNDRDCGGKVGSVWGDCSRYC